MVYNIVMMKKLLIITFFSWSLIAVAISTYSLGFFGWIDSGSMKPTYQIGSFIFINPSERDLKIGDVIGYKCYNYSKCPKTYTWLIVHRLVKAENGCYQFNGDNPIYNWDDQRINPCLMRDDFILYGVVHRLPIFDK